MPRKKIRTTERKINQFLKESRGQGEGKEYIPWIKVGEYSSKGRGHRIFGIKTGREHHFFSDLEAGYYYILLWVDSVLDIREQFPLFPVSETEQIAQDLGVKHPQDNVTKVSRVMTTDFLITVRDGNSISLEARFVKPSSKLNNRRVEEKRQIEEHFWQERDISFKIVTEKSYSRIKAANIRTIMSNYSTPSLDVMDNNKRLDMAYALFYGIHKNEGLKLSSITTSLDNQYGIPAGSALRLFYHLVAHKLIPVKIDEQFIPTKKIIELIDIPKFKTMSIFKAGDLLEYYA